MGNFVKLDQSEVGGGVVLAVYSRSTNPFHPRPLGPIFREKLNLCTATCAVDSNPQV